MPKYIAYINIGLREESIINLRKTQDPGKRDNKLQNMSNLRCSNFKTNINFNTFARNRRKIL